MKRLYTSSSVGKQMRYPFSFLFIPIFAGSHGDGDPANTETPIVAWGAGVRGPGVARHEHDIDDGDRFVDQHTHHEKTPDSWHLKHVERTDVNQGDIAALMVCDIYIYI